MRNITKQGMSKTGITFIFPMMLLASVNNSYAMELIPTIEDAIIHNPEYRQSIKIYQAAEADLDVAEGDWLPTIDIAAGIGKERIDRDNTSTDLTRKEASISLKQNLFKGFKTVNEIDRSEARKDDAIYTAESRASQIALDMAEAYIDLIKEQELLQIEDESLQTHQTILDQIMQRSEAGIGNQVEVDQAKARLALANSNNMSARNNFSDALARFNRVLGRMPDSELIKPEIEFTFPETLEDATDVALLKHPTLRAANADIAEAQAQYRSERSSLYPEVDFELSKSLDRDTNGVEGKNHNFQAMLRLNYNLFNGGKDVASIDGKESEVQQAAEIRNNSRRQTIENLRYAWNARSFLASQLEYNEEHIKLTYETLVGYRKQFSLGRRSLLDLLNTEDEYNSALRKLVENEAEHMISEFRILDGMGTLIDTLNIQVKYNEVDHDYTEM